MSDAPTLPDRTGWAHSAEHNSARAGHCFDVGRLLCGRDPGSPHDAMELHPEPPADAVCPSCRAIVERAGGIQHMHVWENASVPGEPASVCRCKQTRPEAGQ